MPAPATAWMWWISGWGLAAAGALLLLFALFADRAKGRPRCPRCWYDMAGARALTCPECGKGVTHERRLFHTRRRWRRALLAILLTFVGTQLAAQPDRETEPRWLRAVPSSLLVLLAQHGDAAWFNALSEWERDVHVSVWYRSMWSWQRMLAEKIAMPLSEDDVRAMFKASWAWTSRERPNVSIHVPDSAYGLMGARERTINVRWLNFPGAESQARIGWLALRERLNQLLAVKPALPANSLLVDRRPTPTMTLELSPRPAGDYTDRFIVEIRNADGWLIRRWHVDVASTTVK